MKLRAEQAADLKDTEEHNQEHHKREECTGSAVVVEEVSGLKATSFEEGCGAMNADVSFLVLLKQVEHLLYGLESLLG